MTAYFASVITAAVISALTSLLSPDDSKTGKYVRHIAGLVTLLIIIEPLSGISERLSEQFPQFDGLPDYETETDTDYREYIIEKAEAVLREDIQNELFTKFRISKAYTSVDVTLDTLDYANVTVKEIVITLGSYGAWADKASIERYFSEKYTCEAVVTYE